MVKHFAPLRAVSVAVSNKFPMHQPQASFAVQSPQVVKSLQASVTSSAGAGATSAAASGAGTAAAAAAPRRREELVEVAPMANGQWSNSLRGNGLRQAGGQIDLLVT